MKPHKHAELIKAWADGAEIEYLHIGKEGWQPIFKGWSWDSDFAIQYRIKPKSKSLSDEEIWEVWQEAKKTALSTGNSNPIEVVFAREIEERLRIQYRIKPEPKPDVVICEHLRSVEDYTSPCGYSIMVDCNMDNNIRYIFDGETGELKSAEVLK